MAHINIKLIEETRKDRGLTQTELAKRMGISRYLYSLLKLGHRKWSVNHVEAIWRELGLSLDEIIVMRRKKSFFDLEE